jgi:hypothetical protein
MKDIVNRKELKNLNVNNVNMNNMNNMNNVNMMQNASNASNVDVNTRDGKTTAWKYCKITGRKGFTLSIYFIMLLIITYKILVRPIKI